MAGQSASLSLKEACAMQNRIQHSGTQTPTGTACKPEGSMNPKKKKGY